MKNNRTILFLIIFAVCIFCFVSCGRNDTTGSVPNGTGTGSGSVSGNTSNDTINSNRGNADGGMADNTNNVGVVDGAAGDVVDGARNVVRDVTNGVSNGIDDVTGNSRKATDSSSDYADDSMIGSTTGTTTTNDAATSNFGTDSMNAGGNTTANY